MGLIENPNLMCEIVIDIVNKKLLFIIIMKKDKLSFKICKACIYILKVFKRNKWRIFKYYWSIGLIQQNMDKSNKIWINPTKYG